MTTALQHISGHFIMVTLITVRWKIMSVLLVNTHVVQMKSTQMVAHSCTGALRCAVTLL